VSNAVDLRVRAALRNPTATRREERDEGVPTRSRRAVQRGVAAEKKKKPSAAARRFSRDGDKDEALAQTRELIQQSAERMTRRRYITVAAGSAGAKRRERRRAAAGPGTGSRRCTSRSPTRRYDFLGFARFADLLGSLGQETDTAATTPRKQATGGRDDPARPEAVRFGETLNLDPASTCSNGPARGPRCEEETRVDLHERAYHTSVSPHHERRRGPTGCRAPERIPRETRVHPWFVEGGTRPPAATC